MIQQRLAVLSELEGNFSDAVGYYKKSILLTINDERIEELRKCIERCEYKIGLGS